jgi:hypothetical protein
MTQPIARTWHRLRMSTVGDGEHASDDYTPQHVNSEEPASRPARDFTRHFNENLREILLIVCGGGGATLGGFWRRSGATSPRGNGCWVCSSV